MNDQAAERFKELMQFVAHEVRGPLMSLRAGLSMIAMDHPEGETKVLVDKLLGQVSHLDRMLKAIYSKDSLGSCYHLESIDLLKLLRKLIADQSLDAKVDLSLSDQAVSCLGYWNAQLLENALNSWLRTFVSLNKIHLQIREESEFFIIRAEMLGAKDIESAKALAIQSFASLLVYGTQIDIEDEKTAIIIKLPIFPKFQPHSQ